MEYFFVSADKSHQSREKQKARELRKSQWWRQQLGMRTCHYCGDRFEGDQLTMDHIIPIARGGKTSKKNVVVSCKECNSSKGYKLLHEWSISKQSEDDCL